MPASAACPKDVPVVELTERGPGRRCGRRAGGGCRRPARVGPSGPLIAGHQYVTANKALLATHGGRARRAGRATRRRPAGQRERRRRNADDRDRRAPRRHRRDRPAARAGSTPPPPSSSAAMGRGRSLDDALRESLRKPATPRPIRASTSTGATPPRSSRSWRRWRGGRWRPESDVESERHQGEVTVGTGSDGAPRGRRRGLMG